MKIAFVVGIEADSYSDHGRSPWLKDMPKEIYELSNSFDEPSSDICVAFYCLGTNTLKLNLFDGKILKPSNYTCTKCILVIMPNIKLQSIH